MRRLLTEKLARGASTDKVQEDIWDTAIDGFGLRVSARGTRTWVLVYRSPVTGQRRRAHLGRYPVVNADKAREAAKEKVGEIAAGRDPQETATASTLGGPTFAALADAYIERFAKPKRPRTWERQQREIARKLLPRWGTKRAAAIRKRDVIELVDSLPANGARGGKIGANRLLSLISTIYRWGKRADLVEVNPATDIERPGQERRRERVLTDVEIRAFWLACEEDGSTLARAYQHQLLTLQRIHEVLRYRFQDVRGDWWMIPADFIKGKHPHQVYLAPLTLSVIAAVPRPSEKATLARRRNAEVWLYPAKRAGKHPHVTVPRKGLLRVRGGADWWGHDLRRTAHTVLGELGVSRFTRELLVGHLPKDAGTHYDLYEYRREMQAAWELWASYVERVVHAPASSAAAAAPSPA